MLTKFHDLGLPGRLAASNASLRSLGPVFALQRLCSISISTARAEIWYGGMYILVIQVYKISSQTGHTLLRCYSEGSTLQGRSLKMWQESRPLKLPFGRASLLVQSARPTEFQVKPIQNLKSNRSLVSHFRAGFHSSKPPIASGCDPFGLKFDMRGAIVCI